MPTVGQSAADRTDYATLKCMGCEAVQIAELELSASDADQPSRVSYFPRPYLRRLPDWLSQLDPTLHDILLEIYAAHREGLPRLAAMGIRAALDYLMVSEIGDVGSFKQKLNEFHNKGYISAIDRDTLDAVIELGSASIHRGFKPNADTVDRVLDILEGTIQSISINKPYVTTIRTMIPPRP